MTLFRLFLACRALAVVVVLGLTASAHADTLLTYTGMPFNDFYSPDNQHSVAGTNVSGYVLLAGDVLPTGSTFSGAAVLDWSLSSGTTSGGFTLGPSTHDALTAFTVTVVNGQVTDWIFAALNAAAATSGNCFYCTPGAQLVQTTHVQGDASVVQSATSYSGVYESSTVALGTWTVSTVSAVPEPAPAAMWSLGLGALGCLGAARRRRGAVSTSRR